jgi:hypothetical protein
MSPAGANLRDGRLTQPRKQTRPKEAAASRKRRPRQRPGPGRRGLRGSGARQTMRPPKLPAQTPTANRPTRASTSVWERAAAAASALRPHRKAPMSWFALGVPPEQWQPVPRGLGEIAPQTYDDDRSGDNQSDNQRNEITHSLNITSIYFAKRWRRVPVLIQIRRPFLDTLRFPFGHARFMRTGGATAVDCGVIAAGPSGTSV